MNKTIVLAAVSTFLTLCIVFPIFVFLLYSVLKAAEVDRLTWFLFWVYIPVACGVNILHRKLVEAQFADQIEEIKDLLDKL